MKTLLPVILFLIFAPVALGVENHSGNGDSPSFADKKNGTAPENHAAPVVRFHRVLVPEDRMKDWPLGGAKHLPIDAAEFERLTSAARARGSTSATAPPAAALSARYEAKLVGERLIGRASLDVHLTGASPALLPFARCNVAINRAAWGDCPDLCVSKNATVPFDGTSQKEKTKATELPEKIPEPAQLGLADDGRLGVLVERAGRLNFEWSLAGRRDSSDTLNFAFEIPAAPANQFVLDLPEELAPTVDRGLLLGGETQGEGFRRWRIEMGGRDRFRLRVAPAGADRQQRQLALLRESRTYDCSLRGVDVSAQWKIQVHNEPLQQVAVLLDPELQLVSARLGDAAIAWSATPASDGSGTRVALRLPEPIRDAERIIRLSAIGRPSLDRPWRLPRIRVEGPIWQEGGISLLVSEPLVIDRLDPVGCAQTGAGLLSPPRRGQTMTFQSFDPDSTVEVVLSRRAEKVELPDASATKTGDDAPHQLKPTDLAPDELAMLDEPPKITPATKTATGRGDAVPSKVSVKIDAPTAEPRKILRWGMESWHPSSGMSRYVAAYEVQVGGRKSLRFSLLPTLPRENLRGVWIDDAPAEWMADASENTVCIALPPDRRIVRVVMEWSASAAPLGAFGSLVEAAMPRPDLPLPAGSWRAWLPPGYEAVGVQGDTDNLGLSDWTAYVVELPVDATTTVALRYVRVASIRLSGAAVFLMIAGLGFWWIRRKWPRPVAAETLAAPAGSGSTMTKVIPTVLAIFCLLASSAWCGAAPAEEMMHRVLVPIDANRKPVGGKVFVPELLYQELHRRSTAPAGRPLSWMLLEVVYRGELIGEGASGRFTVPVLQAQCELQVFERAARIRIPMRIDGANLLPGSVTLDGRAIEPEWEPDATALSFEAAETGRHRLELSLRPAMQNADRSGGFDMAIPRVARARLELDLPADAPAVEVPSALGGIERAADAIAGAENGSPPLSAFRTGAGRFSAELGPTDRLTVRWPEGAMSNGARAAIDSEELIWLKVQPGSVVVATRFHLRVAEGRIEEVQLAVDPKLRLLPLPGDDPPAVQIGSETGSLRSISIRWPRPITDRVTLDATFLAAGVSAVGKIRPPRVEMLDVQTTRRWMALSVDPALDADEEQDNPLESVPVAEFLKAWNGESQTSLSPENRLGVLPQAAFRLPSGQTDWTLSTRPHEPRIAVDHQLAICYGQDRAAVRFDARLSVASGYVFQHRLIVPQGLDIEHVSVVEDGVDRVQRWSRNNGELTVFLNGPASGTQELSIRGRMSVALGKKTELPAIVVEKWRTRSVTISLYRRPEVKLTIDPRDTLALGGNISLLWERQSASPWATSKIWTNGIGADVSNKSLSDFGIWVHTVAWDGIAPPRVSVVVEADAR